MGSILAIGLTSDDRDGIDAALIETDGHRLARPVAHHFTPFAPRALELLDQARAIGLDMERPDHHPVIAEADEVITNLYLGAVDALLRVAAVSRPDVEVIGCLGHRIAHRPERSWTWQIGDGARLARMSGMDVVDGFRAADVTMGGRGDPLLPVFHRALTVGQTLSAVVLALGAQPMLTHVGADGGLTAFVTEAGEALTDFLARIIPDLPAPATALLVTGGARADNASLSSVSRAFGLDACLVENLGWQSDAIGAQCAAYLAMRQLKMLPITFPGTTGAPYAMGGGTYHKGRVSDEELLAKSR